HGGAGSPSQFSDRCEKACKTAFQLLEKGGNSLDAVTEAARILEDDGRFNAGSGSVLRLDGKTIEMDASVMDSKGNIGIVIAIRNVKNPILVARSVTNTPHIALSGEGATAFARKKGFKPFYNVSKYALERYKRLKQLIKEGKLSKESPIWKGYDVESLWNFDNISYEEAFCDTIGAVAIDKKGVFAVANSTGGFSPMLLGRVGDSGMIGCGFYAGPSGAIATTGAGEEIIRRMFAKCVYDIISAGEDVRKACKKGIEMFPPEIKAGIIAITRTDFSVEANTEMAHYALVKER
ncbi:MAG: isoaspartyl peptidase/L-asparaginase, partial [Nitrospirae bacterium]|nr:isoaspartyl peptidase/L-asparaginase [Nitrospirota bacterium]